MLDQSEWVYGYKFKELDNGDDIIYLDTHEVAYIRNVFKSCYDLNYLDKPCTLVTHNSDYSVSMAMPKDIPIPPNLVWYSVNVDIYHPQIKAIPIGLENPHWHPYKPYALQKAISEPIKEKTFYFNLMINPVTNPDYRNRVIANFRNNYKNMGYIAETINGQDYNTYLNIIKNSDFTICPEGNGIDTHRIWESLYLEVWPIVQYNVHNDLLCNEGLPIAPVSLCTIDSEAFLEIFYMTKQHKEQYKNYDTIKMSYWADKIRNRK